jgi:hypothetical protein
MLLINVHLVAHQLCVTVRHTRTRTRTVRQLRSWTTLGVWLNTLALACSAPAPPAPNMLGVWLNTLALACSAPAPPAPNILGVWLNTPHSLARHPLRRHRTCLESDSTPSHSLARRPLRRRQTCSESRSTPRRPLGPYTRLCPVQEPLHTLQHPVHRLARAQGFAPHTNRYTLA